MKIKRSSSKKQLHKWAKLGVGLAAVTVLGGLVEPVGLADFGLTKVYAETYVNTSDQLIGVVIWHIAENTDGSSFRLNGDGGYMEVQPGQEIISSAPNYDGYTLSHTTYAPPVWDGGDGILSYVYKQNKIAEQPEEPAGDTNSTDTNTVNYTVQLVDENGETLQTIQQSGVEGTEVRFDFPVVSGYRVGKTEGFDSWTYGKSGTFRIVANKTVKVYYDKAPSIDSLIRPEQRVEYQKVFDTFHTTVLKAFEVYKKELGVDHIIRLTEDEAKFNQITQSEDLTTLQLELILVENLFNEPVGLVLTDQDIINAIGWTPEYWDHQIAYHKEIIQKLEKALANIAASKAIPTVPVDQSITIKAVYTEEQIEPGQKVDVLKEIEYTLKPGESVVLEPLAFEGWTSRVVQESQTVTYEEAKARPNKEYYFYYIEEGTTPTEKPIETPAETPTEKPAEQLVEKPTEQPVEKLVERPTASPTEQSAPGKQATKQGDKEPAAPASQSKQSTVKPASTSQPQAKSLPATGEASSVLHLTGLGLLGLAGLVVKRRPRKSS
ncbi:LPXTG cell wall anchor domain-containing protein [Streptococcus suis]|uniref:LPXTG cell wall anchor domain-containing protein n=1 Tax=Streptococcus suis TaxID=1307 RepID=UPI0038B9E482